jgi:hypothetical protein
MAEGEEEGGLQPGLSSEGLRQAGEAKGKGVQTPDSRLLRLVQQKRFFFYEKSSLKTSRSPITLQKTRFLLVAKARISPVACLFVCLFIY